jgi:hypothetical protein
MTVGINGYYFINVKVKVKVFRYKPGVALEVPGG